MSVMLASLAGAVLAMAAPAAAEFKSPLIGTWRITSQTTTLTDADGKVTQYSKEPLGHIIVTPDRIMVITMDRGRKPAETDADKARLLDSMAAYSGRIVVDPEKYVITMDYTSTMRQMDRKQVRYYKVDGDTASISTEPGPSMMQPGKIAQTKLTLVRDK